MLLFIPSKGDNGRERDAHVHHSCEPAQALCPVRPGGRLQEAAAGLLFLSQGEDRWLCTLLLKQGWRVEYSAASDSFTACPEVNILTSKLFSM